MADRSAYGVALALFLVAIMLIVPISSSHSVTNRRNSSTGLYLDSAFTPLTYTSGTTPDITITVENYNNVLAYNLNGVTNVVLYATNGTELANESINSQSQVNFYNLKSGYITPVNYNIEVYHRPYLSLNFPEYWGSATYGSYIGPLGGTQDTQYTFVRNQAIIQHISLSSQTIGLGSSLVATTTLYNPGKTTLSAESTMYMSTVQATSLSDPAGVMADSSTWVSIPSGSTATSTTRLTPSEPGTYYFDLSASTGGSSNPSYTDQILWTTLPTVTVQPPLEQITMGAYSGGSIQYSYPSYLGYSGKTGSATSSSSFTAPAYDKLTLTATPSSGYSFTSWGGDISGSSNPYTFSVAPYPMGVTPTFTRTTYPVTLDAGQGGKIDYSYGSTTGYVAESQSNEVLVPSGDTITLTGVPDANEVFKGWSGTFSSTSNPATFTIHGSSTIDATFNSGLSADLSASTTSPVVGNSVGFSVSVFGGSGIYTYAYYVNNGLIDTTSSSSFSYTFTSLGQFTVYSEVTDNGVSVASNPVTVTVRPLPLDVSISPLSESVMTGQSLNFASSVSGGEQPYSYSWYINSNLFSQSSSFSHAFSSAGTYEVYLSVSDSYGTTQTSPVTTIVVSQVPALEASISASTTSTYIGQAVDFSSQVSGGNGYYSYQWYVGTEQVSGATSSTYTLVCQSSGTFRVYLNVTDSAGVQVNSNSVTVTATVQQGSLSVEVYNPNGTPVLGAYVALYTGSGDTGKIDSGYIQSTGILLFTGISPGTYYVSASAVGHVSQQQKIITSTSGSILSITLQLKSYSINLYASPGGNLSYTTSSGTEILQPGHSANLVLLYGQDLVLDAQNTTGKVFSGWSGIISGNSNPYSLDVTGSGNVYDSFASDSFTVVFNEKGIGANLGLPWNVTLNHITESGQGGGSIVFTDVKKGTYSFSSEAQYFSVFSTSVPEASFFVAGDTTVNVNFAASHTLVAANYNLILSPVYNNIPRNTYPFTLQITYLNLGSTTESVPTSLPFSRLVKYDPSNNAVLVSSSLISNTYTISPEYRMNAQYSVTVSWNVAVPMKLSSFLKSTFTGLGLDFIGDSLGNPKALSTIQQDFFSSDSKYASMWPAVEFLLKNGAEWAKDVHTGFAFSKALVGLLALTGSGDFMLADNITFMPQGVYSAHPINVTVSAQENKIVLAYADVAAYFGTMAASTGLKMASLAVLGGCAGIISCPLAIAASGALLAASVLIGPVTSAVFQKELSDPNSNYTNFTTIKSIPTSIVSISNLTVRQLSIDLYYYEAYLNASAVSNTKAYYADEVNNSYYGMLQDQLALNYSRESNYYFSLVKNGIGKTIAMMENYGLLTNKSFFNGKAEMNASGDFNRLALYEENLGLSQYINYSSIINVSYTPVNLSAISNLTNPTENLTLNDQIALIVNNYTPEESSTGYSQLIFMQSGLPNGTAWHVTLGSKDYASTEKLLSINVSSGSYLYQGYTSYNYTEPTGYATASPGNSTFVMVGFSKQATYRVEFIPSGIPGNTTWHFAIGHYNFSGIGNMTVWMPNGTYHPAYGNIPDYNLTANGTFVVNGSWLNISVNYQKILPPRPVPIMTLISLAAILVVSLIMAYSLRRRRDR